MTSNPSNPHKMISCTLRVLVLPILLLFAGFARADNFDSEVASVILLQNKAVQREIGLTEEERARMNVYADEHRARLKAYYQELEKDHKTSADQGRLLEMFAVMKKGVIAQLTAAQLKRLREISLQSLDFEALADTTVANRVGLSPSEVKRVRAIVKDGLEKANGIRNKAISQAIGDLRNKKPKSQKEADAIQSEAEQRAKAAVSRVSDQILEVGLKTKTQTLAVLSNGERAKWQELLGRPFKPVGGG